MNPRLLLIGFCVYLLKIPIETTRSVVVRCVNIPPTTETDVSLVSFIPLLGFHIVLTQTELDTLLIWVFLTSYPFDTVPCID